MKVLIIPDSHLQSWMFQVADNIMEKYNYDQVVVLGDLVDSHINGKDLTAYARMFETCIEFARKYKSKLIWLYGNHEVAYLDPYHCMCSGHNYEAEPLVTDYLHELIEILGYTPKIAARIDKVLFSHGGIAETYDYVAITEKAELEGVLNTMIDTLNSKRYQGLWELNSPLWYRPNDCIFPSMMDGCIQVAGHTPMRVPYLFHNLLLVDTFYSGGFNLFPVLDTETYAVSYIDVNLDIVDIDEDSFVKYRNS